jgi:putative ABC transport system permease protein
MFRHYLVTALRSFAHHKLYGFINVVGLSIGLACAILIGLYVRDQLSYDKWVPHTADLYRLEMSVRLPGNRLIATENSSFPVLTAMAEQIPQVKAVTRARLQSMTVRVGEKQFREETTVVDPDFFQVIQLPLARGDPARVLAQPDSVVLSDSTARKYFGSADPVGKVLTVTPDMSGACSPADGACLSATYPLTVTGVLRDLPHNTQLFAAIVLPNNSRADAMPQSEKVNGWLDTWELYGYVRLLPGADPQAVLKELKPILDREIDPKKYGMSGDLLGSQISTYHMTPFRGVHLSGVDSGGMTPGGSWSAVYGFSALAVLIVLIACFNFTNLATARATLRAREVAVRKLTGARRRQLIAQFLGEAVLLALIALAIALSLVEILLPAYDRFLGQPVGIDYLSNWEAVLAVLAGTVAVGLVSGLYPALILSRLRPAAALKPAVSVGTGSGLLRSVLVVAQFAVSIGLGVAALVMLRQIEYTRSLDMGFRRDGIVVIQGVAKLTASARKSLADSLRSDPRIEGAAYSSGVPFDTAGMHEWVYLPGQQQFTAEIMNISPQFPSVYGIRLLAGRLLSAKRGQDLSSVDPGTGRVVPGNVLINAQAARRLGLNPTEAIGRSIHDSMIRSGSVKIVGVLSDAMIDGFMGAVQPTIFFYDPKSQAMTDLSVRIRGNQVPGALADIDRTWRDFEPGAVISRYFLSETFDDQFTSIDRQGVMLGAFVTIAILIACLGLFGLAVFTAERRTKEIGVRKVSGARTVDIVRLMLWRISVPVLVANVIAWPIAYAYLRHWLAGYAYRIALDPLYFVAGGAVALLIAWATVYGNTLRLARANPVHALRYE